MKITTTFVDIFFLTVDHDQVQTLGDFSIGIANGHSGLIITPSLGFYHDFSYSEFFKFLKLKKMQILLV